MNDIALIHQICNNHTIIGTCESCPFWVHFGEESCAIKKSPTFWDLHLIRKILDDLVENSNSAESCVIDPIVCKKCLDNDARFCVDCPRVDPLPCGENNTTKATIALLKKYLQSKARFHVEELTGLHKFREWLSIAQQ